MVIHGDRVDGRRVAVLLRHLESRKYLYRSSREPAILFHLGDRREVSAAEIVMPRGVDARAPQVGLVQVAVVGVVGAAAGAVVRRHVPRVHGLPSRLLALRTQQEPLNNVAGMQI